MDLDSTLLQPRTKRLSYGYTVQAASRHTARHFLPSEMRLPFRSTSADFVARFRRVSRSRIAGILRYLTAHCGTVLAALPFSLIVSMRLLLCRNDEKRSIPHCSC